LKNRIVKKKLIRILKKLTGSVRFYKPETEPKPKKNKKKNRANWKRPSQTWKKPSQTVKNRAKLQKPSQTGLN
jgi:hypothetical protein